MVYGKGQICPFPFWRLMSAINPGLIPGNSGDYQTGIYFPYVCNITAITQEVNATVTTDVAHMFSVGNQVRFQIPSQYGMRQLNGLKGIVLDIPSTTEITVDVDTSNFNAFSVPSLAPFVVIDPAQVIPVGDYNQGYLSPGGVQPFQKNPPGSFTVTLFPGG
jgi:hypothetical protein